MACFSPRAPWRPAALGKRREAEAADYPPALSGLRGQTATSFAVMHALRDGTSGTSAGTPEATGETYDLVVVGGGISGLAAAFLYRQQAGGKARVLILEAAMISAAMRGATNSRARNGRKIIGYGGSQSLQTPSYFSAAVKQLLADIAIDTEKFKTYYDQDWAERHRLGAGVFFRKELFGADRLVKQTDRAADWVPKTPLNDKARRDLIELIDAPRDYLPGKSREEKLEILSETTYADFLTRSVRLRSAARRLFPEFDGRLFRHRHRCDHGARCLGQLESRLRRHGSGRCA